MVATEVPQQQVVSQPRIPRSGEFPEVSPKGKTAGHWVRRWVYRLALLGFLALLVFFVFFASKHWNALHLSRTEVIVEPQQTTAYYAVSAGGMRLNRPYFAGERLEENEQLGVIDSQQLNRRIELRRTEIQLIERQLGQLSQRMLSVEGKPLAMQLDEEIRHLGKEIRLAEAEVALLERQRDACQVVCPTTGWLVEDIPQNAPLVENDVVFRVAPVGTPMWLRIDAPGKLLEELSRDDGFSVRLLTSQGEVDCLAVRADHPIQTRTEVDDDGRREVWVTFYAHIQSDDPEPLPGMRGAVASFRP